MKWQEAGRCVGGRDALAELTAGKGVSGEEENASGRRRWRRLLLADNCG
jgi:hypothetical protein